MVYLRCAKFEAMKRTLVYLVLMVATATVAGAKHRKHNKSKPIHKGITAVKVRFGACYGRCPEYSVAIDREGKVTYTGVRFTADTGVFEKKADPTETSRILDMFETYRVDTCANRYRVRIPDVSVYDFSVTYNDSVKAILNATFGPSYLQVLTSELNAVGKKVDNEGWKRVPAGHSAVYRK